MAVDATVWLSLGRTGAPDELTALIGPVRLWPQARTIHETAERDGSVTAWDVDGARRLGRSMRWNTPDTGCGAGVCTVVNRQDTVVATVQADGSIALIDPRALRLLHTLPARNGPVSNGLAFAPDGRTLVTGGATGRVTLWNVGTQRVVRTLKFPGAIDAAAVSPDGRLLAVQSPGTGGTDSRVTVRELASGRTLFTRAVRYGEDGLSFIGGELVAVGCCQPGSTVVAWDARSGAELFTRTLPEHAVSIQPTPDARLLAVGTEAGKLLFWDPRTGRPSAPAPQVAAGGISQLSFARDSRRRIAVGAVDGTATVWDIRDRKRVGEPFPISTNLTPRGRVRAPGAALHHRARRRQPVAARRVQLGALRLQRREPRPHARRMARPPTEPAAPARVRMTSQLDRPVKPFCAPSRAAGSALASAVEIAVKRTSLCVCRHTLFTGAALRPGIQRQMRAVCRSDT